jgi:hypothetical protein
MDPRGQRIDFSQLPEIRINPPSHREVQFYNWVEQQTPATTFTRPPVWRLEIDVRLAPPDARGPGT